MSKDLSAVLIKDVSYLDFAGAKHIIPAGKRVQISKLTKPAIAYTSAGGKHLEELESFIATVGDVSFDLRRDQFAVDN